MGDVDQLRHTRERYYTSPMSMGKRKRDRQPAMWVTTTDLPTAASHPFYRRLNQLLREHGFDDFVAAQCAGFYPALSLLSYSPVQPSVIRRPYAAAVRLMVSRSIQSLGRLLRVPAIRRISFMVTV